jgi:hypothetical protein
MPRYPLYQASSPSSAFNKNGDRAKVDFAHFWQGGIAGMGPSWLVKREMAPHKFFPVDDRTVMPFGDCRCSEWS